MPWTVAGTDPSGATIMQNEFGETQLVAAQAAPEAMAPFMGAEQFPAVPEPESAQPPMLAYGDDSIPTMNTAAHNAMADSGVATDAAGTIDPQQALRVEMAKKSQAATDTALQEAEQAGGWVSAPAGGAPDPTQARTGVDHLYPPSSKPLSLQGTENMVVEEQMRRLANARFGGGGGRSGLNKARADVDAARDAMWDARRDVAGAAGEGVQARAGKEQDAHSKLVSSVEDLKRKEANDLAELDRQREANKLTRARVQENLNEMKGMNVDPGRVLNTAPKKIMAVFAKILSAGAASLRGDARNLAAEEINRQIQTDIDAQKFNIQKERARLQDVLGVSEREAQDMVSDYSLKAKARHKELLQAQLVGESMLKTTTNPEMKASLEAINAGLEEQIAGAEYDMQVGTYQDLQKRAARKAAFARQQQEKAIERARKERELQLKEADHRLNVYKATEGGEGAAEKKVLDLPGIGKVDLSTLSRQERVEVERAAADYNASYSQLEGMGEFLEREGTAKFGEAGALGLARRKGIIKTVGRQLEGGKMTEADEVAYEQMSADPSSIFTGRQKAKNEQLKKLVRDNMLGQLRARGVNIGAAAEVTPEGIRD